MKKGLGILLLVLGVLMCASTVYAAQAIVLDPLVDYEVQSGVTTYVTVGASFKDYGNHTQRVISVAGINPGMLTISNLSNRRIAGHFNTGTLAAGLHVMAVTVFDYNTGTSAQGTFKIKVVANEPHPPITFDSTEIFKVAQSGVFYSIPIGANRADGSILAMNVAGGVNDGTDLIEFVKTVDIGGRIAGILRVQLGRRSEYTVNVCVIGEDGLRSVQQLKIYGLSST